MVHLGTFTSLLDLNISATASRVCSDALSAHKDVFAAGGNARVSRAGSCWRMLWGAVPIHLPSSVSPNQCQFKLGETIVCVVLGQSSKKKREDVAAFVQPLLFPLVRLGQSPSIRWMQVCFPRLSCSGRGSTTGVLAAETLYLFLHEVTPLKIRC